MNTFQFLSLCESCTVLDSDLKLTKTGIVSGKITVKYIDVVSFKKSYKGLVISTKSGNYLIQKDYEDVYSRLIQEDNNKLLGG